MLSVLTPTEALAAMEAAFPPCPEPETVPLAAACGRVLCASVTAAEYVPDFDRSTVDGYAVRASDTFGCSDALPAILTLSGVIRMGEDAPAALKPGCCMAIPTGGALPEGADAAVMVEYTEDYGDGTVGICKPAAPGMNLIFRGDDVRPGRTVLPAGRRLLPPEIGALAALGVKQVAVSRALRVAILSTGDELVPAEASPGPGQVRDVNSAALRALMEQAGAAVTPFGILRDDEALLKSTLETALETCDLVLVSGGSSVGEKDATDRVLSELGDVLFHGIAVKPGKPTILAKVGGKPVFGLPGHPAAALLVARTFVLPLLRRLSGCTEQPRSLPATLTEPVSANDGRAQLVAVRLRTERGRYLAEPVRGKSGLITTLADSDGYFVIPRDTEGAAAGETVDVRLFAEI